MALPLAVGVAVGTANFFNNINNSNAEAEAAQNNISFLKKQYDYAVLQGKSQENSIVEKYATLSGITGAKSNQAVGFVSGGSASTAYSSTLTKNKNSELTSSYINEMNKRTAITAKIQNEQNKLQNATSLLRGLTDTTRAIASGLNAYTTVGGKFTNPGNTKVDGLDQGFDYELGGEEGSRDFIDDSNRVNHAIGGEYYRSRSTINPYNSGTSHTYNPPNFNNIFPTLQKTPFLQGGY